ncbi:MAG: DUF938 domain-containing protein [Pseudorhodobacter sp.]
MTLRLPDSKSPVLTDGRRIAPSAERNLAPILASLGRHASASGIALELASGTGQQVAAFAAALPGLHWHPTDVNPDNLGSIAAWRHDAACPNLGPPALLDAGCAGWGAGRDVSLVLAVNLLHLIPQAAARVVVAEAAAALAPGGVLMIYGPFLRDGRATSDGDIAFDASLRAQDPRTGYKDQAEVCGWMQAAGLRTLAEEMPANNLMLVAFRDQSGSCPSSSDSPVP